MPVTLAPDPAVLIAALQRLLATASCPAYVRAAAAPWLAAQGVQR